MYKVFVKKHIIIVSSKEEFINVFEAADYHLLKPKKKAIKALLLEINLKRKRRIIHFETDNAAKTFKKLCSQFKLIIAAGGIVKNQEGRILFIFRNGKWDLPKGKLEKGEDIETCAVREVEEECGISGVKLQDLCLITYHTYKQKDNVLKPTYWYHMTYDGTEELIPQLEEGITKVKWVKPEKLAKVRKNTYTSINDVLNKI